MALNGYRLDPAGLRGLVVGLEPAVRNGQQRQTSEGVLEWNVSLLVRVEGQRPETVIVRIPSATAPKIPDLSEVEPVEPFGRFWQMTNGSGFSITASGIQAVRAVAPVADDGKAKAGAAA